MLLNREDGIKKTLNFCFAMFELVFGNALGMNTHFVDHATRCMLEVGIVLEKVSMAEDMCRYKSVLQQVIHIHQEGITRIGVDHHLIDFAQPEVILHLLPVICFSMCPVAKATG